MADKSIFKNSVMRVVVKGELIEAYGGCSPDLGEFQGIRIAEQRAMVGRLSMLPEEIFEASLVRSEISQEDLIAMVGRTVEAELFIRDVPKGKLASKRSDFSYYCHKIEEVGCD